MDFSFTEIIGYIASAVILFSFLMKNFRTFRIINSLGGCIFIVYGVLLHYSIPIILTNAAIVGINVFYLIRNRSEH